MAAFVVTFGFTPAQFYDLTRAEYAAIVAEYNRRNRR